MATQKVTIPNFDDVQEMVVVEVYVSLGDVVEKEGELIALESEKAVMDIPSPLAGVVKEIYLQEGDKVKSGADILLLELAAAGEAVEESSAPQPSLAEPLPEHPAAADQKEARADSDRKVAVDQTVKQAAVVDNSEGDNVVSHATPSVRAYARQLGVELAQLAGSGPKGRVVKEDVQNFVKQLEKAGSAPPAASVSGIDDASLEDFSKYGIVEDCPLGRIKKISGPHLHRSWTTVPHVTHFDEADVSELESFHKQINSEMAAEALRFSPLVFIIKAVVASLKEYPVFNSSLDSSEAKLILKKYYHIGIAVDTPSGLVVPVVRDADSKGLTEIAAELKRLGQAARAEKLGINEMRGASFTISSLGGIGGVGFTPIVNAPQVAILGLAKNYLKPVWDLSQEKFTPRLTLPFSVSYDHRVIDGADAARFCRSLSANIEDLRRTLL
ncbi:MAG: branched-chain alpha-keto acid dehydrogenase subunit E2 [Deltaproteobacteria bacterium]|nr:MAG: branched-chain alpha-keto acid dehydrogenase subunit E2 [Deltaproteobacteria bacterium]